MSIDARMLTSAAEANGSHDLKMDLAVCSFDRSGKAIQCFQEKLSQQFAAQAYASMHGVPHGPDPEAASNVNAPPNGRN